MDGFALGVLIAAQRDVRRSGGCVRVTNHPTLLRLLAFTGITGLFTLEAAQMR
jgi:anti-anti-sigma regulatory factor